MHLSMFDVITGFKGLFFRDQAFAIPVITSGPST